MIKTYFSLFTSTYALLETEVGRFAYINGSPILLNISVINSESSVLSMDRNM